MICVGMAICVFVGFGFGLYAGYSLGWEERGYCNQMADDDVARERDALIAISTGRIAP